MEIVVDRLNYFDGNFQIFSRNSASDYLFGYSNEKACIINKGYRGYTVSFQNINSFERSHINLINFSIDFKKLIPISCFEYNNYGYLFFKNIQNNEILFIRGQNEKVIKNMTFDLFKYDHIDKKLYLINNLNVYKIDTNSLEKLWTNHKQNAYEKIKIEHTGNLTNNITDFLIIESNVYFIKDYKIFKYPLENSNDLKFVSYSNSQIFNFLPYKIEKEIKIGNSSHFWLYLLYIFDVFMFLLCAYALKRIGFKFKKTKKRNNFSEVYQSPPLVLRSILPSDSSKSGDSQSI